MRPARLHQRRGAVEQCACSLRRNSSAPGRTRHLASGLRRHEPVPVQGASINTRSARPSRSASTSPSPLEFAPGHCGRPRVPAGHGSARAGACPVGGIELSLVLHGGGERQRLAAGAGAEIDHLLAGLRAGKQRGELRAFVLHFDQALDEGRLGMDRRDFWRRQRARCASPCGDQRVGAGVRCDKRCHRLFARALERIDPQIERRARRKRRSLGSAILAEDGFELRIEPLRIVARDQGGAPSRLAASSSVRSLAGERRRRDAASRRRAWRSPPHRARVRAAACRARLRAACPRPSRRPPTPCAGARHRRGPLSPHDRPTRQIGAPGPSP